MAYRGADNPIKKISLVFNHQIRLENILKPVPVTVPLNLRGVIKNDVGTEGTCTIELYFGESSRVPCYFRVLLDLRYPAEIQQELEKNMLARALIANCERAIPAILAVENFLLKYGQHGVVYSLLADYSADDKAGEYAQYFFELLTKNAQTETVNIQLNEADKIFLWQKLAAEIDRISDVTKITALPFTQEDYLALQRSSRLPTLIKPQKFSLLTGVSYRPVSPVLSRRASSAYNQLQRTASSSAARPRSPAPLPAAASATAAAYYSVVADPYTDLGLVNNPYRFSTPRNTSVMPSTVYTPMVSPDDPIQKLIKWFEHQLNDELRNLHRYYFINLLEFFNSKKDLGYTYQRAYETWKTEKRSIPGNSFHTVDTDKIWPGYFTLDPITPSINNDIQTFILAQRAYGY